MALSDVPIPAIEAAQTGERDAVERLLKLVSPDLYRIIFSMLRDHDDTDEVLQETLLRIFRYLKNLKEPSKFASWTMRIAVNQVQSWRMKKGRTRLFELPEGMEPDEGVVIVGRAGLAPREAAESRELREEIDRAVTELPARQQTALMLFELEGSSIKEVAQAMACSEGAVKFNLHEARKKLQRRLAHLFTARKAEAPRRTAEEES